MTKSFSEYAADYPRAMAIIADCLSRSYLPRLENIALRFSHALEEKILDLKAGNERVFLVAVLVKTVNEMLAVMGSLRNGALLSSYHHARSIHELFAALEHTYCAPSKRERKLEKFIEYPNVARYLHYLDWQRRLSGGEITEDEFKSGCKVSADAFHDLSKRLPEWKRIWKLKNADAKDIREIKNWHHPASIEGLFQSSEEAKRSWQIYEMICHATHLSPLGRNVTGGNYFIGFPRDGNGFDYGKINQPIAATILGAQKIAMCLHEKVNAGQIEGVHDWVPGVDL